MITFQQGTKLIIDDGANQYEILVGSATASQTFLGANRAVKTIHNPNLVDETFSTEKSAVNLSFSCSLISDPVLMEWFGFTEQTGKHGIDTSKLTAIEYTVYISAGGTIYKIPNCVGKNMSFTLSKASVLQVSISSVGSDLQIVSSIPPTGVLIAQGIPYSGPVIVTGFDRLATLSCEITRGVSWTHKKSIFDIGTMFTTSTPILDSMAISGTITQNKYDNSSNEYNYDVPIIIAYGDTFKINLQSCSSTSRWDMATIHKKVTDYKLQPTLSGSYIQF